MIKIERDVTRDPILEFLLKESEEFLAVEKAVQERHSKGQASKNLMMVDMLNTLTVRRYLQTELVHYLGRFGLSNSDFAKNNVTIQALLDGASTPSSP